MSISIFLYLVEYVNDFSSIEAMENAGWTFSHKNNNAHIQSRSSTMCQHVPVASYCGYTSPGDLILSYTFSYSGIATLKYGQSWDKGCVLVKKNNLEIDSRCSRGNDKTIFAFSSGDVLKLVDTGQSVINIHSLALHRLGTKKLTFLDCMMQ